MFDSLLTCPNSVNPTSMASWSDPWRQHFPTKWTSHSTSVRCCRQKDVTRSSLPLDPRLSIFYSAASASSTTVCFIISKVTSVVILSDNFKYFQVHFLVKSYLQSTVRSCTATTLFGWVLEHLPHGVVHFCTSVLNVIFFSWKVLVGGCCRQRRASADLSRRRHV